MNDKTSKEKNLELWRAQNAIYTKVTLAYDQTLVALSSSGLAFSTTALIFIEKPVDYMCLWTFAIALLFVTLFCTLIAQKMGSDNALDMLRELASRIEGKDHKSARNNKINTLEIFAIASFLVGVILLILFISLNMG